MIDLRPLLQPSFWFNRTPPPLSPLSERALFIVFAALLVLGAIIRMVAGHRKEDAHVTEMFSRIGRLGVTMGILGLVLFFFSFENIPFLGSRFWYIIWMILLVIWIGRIVRYVAKEVPVERALERSRQERQKYLPH